ncbi:MAG: AMP-binding protein, partial [Bacteroidales bacterium]|nr:AMP-binding protein [Bacteroidales bacterium]
PDLIVVVPLLMEKVIRKGVMPKWNSPKVQFMLKIPFLKNYVKNTVRKKLYESLGGNLYEVIIGGAALAPDVEDLLHEIKFPYTVGYGMTECAPILGYRDWKTFVPHSCGRPALGMEIKIDSEDPENKPGEIIAKGKNVMLGYYKNQEATAAAIDKDGWLHTGDMGVIDKDNNIFIRGRVKNMLLSGTGQNIYPEDIEKEISSIPYVAETVVVQRDTRLIGLVFPDREAAAEAGLSDDEQIKKFFESHKAEINKNLAAYSHITTFEIVEKEFEKTPKKSIKRFLYS